jgi:hypothetical protein
MLLQTVFSATLLVVYVLFLILALVKNIHNVRLTSIDHPQIEGAYISGLHVANFIFLVCIWSSGE